MTEAAWLAYLAIGAAWTWLVISRRPDDPSVVTWCVTAVFILFWPALLAWSVYRARR